MLRTLYLLKHLRYCILALVEVVYPDTYRKLAVAGAVLKVNCAHGFAQTLTDLSPTVDGGFGSKEVRARSWHADTFPLKSLEPSLRSFGSLPVFVRTRITRS